jgi:oligopeptide/dipeptide ABC transporter ATP-binding protein
VLIADEPTTALDVTIQAQLLDLLERECRQRGMSLILITHDLGVVASVTDRILVMYAGRVIESGRTRAVFADPRHPYTAGLLASMPRLETPLHSRLNAIPGAPPTGYAEIAGCPFAPRCGHVMDRCRAEEPELASVTHGPPSHRAACFADLTAATRSPA